MVPALFLTVAAIPRLPSGKTDARALGELLAAHVADDHAAEAPQMQPGTAIEGLVASIFQTVLDCPPSMDASFFDQGGDSIGAARVVAAVRSHLKAEGRGVQLRLADFLAMPTVRTLSGWIDRAVCG
jgi:acyl carrier protein